MDVFSHRLGNLGFKVLVCALLWASGAAASWRSSLYPAGWEPPTNSSFATDMLIQDFSYAGYHRGEVPVPEVAGPVFDAVATYGADPTGTTDSTAAIQAAIDAAGAAGGGVVRLSAGTFLLSLPEGKSSVLRIRDNGVVLRGSGSEQTFLLNTSTTNMREKVVVWICASPYEDAPVYLAADLPNPTFRLPLEDASSFAPGDMVWLRWDFTPDWVAEHGQEAYWNSTNGYPDATIYQREIIAVDTNENWIETDIPTRYTVKTRDHARVYKLHGRIKECGVENLLIGNLQHPGSDWDEEDYSVPGILAYAVHANWLFDVQRAYDCWISNVHSYQPDGNTSTCHMLSNGIRIYKSCRITVRDCSMKRPQYGGGGGNGYMYRLMTANDCLVENCLAEFSRHGFVVSHAGSTGDVFHRCEDRTTNHATGSTGSYVTSLGDGSDNHMHFSHSCLWDQCRAFDSFWEATHRGTVGNQGLTAAHGVYWNTSGDGTAYPDKLVVTEQARYGYVIGTSGSSSKVWNRDPARCNTWPLDFVEGEGKGASLFPASLYLDQLARRMGRTGSTITVVSTSSAEPGSVLDAEADIAANGLVSSPSSGMAVSGLVRELGARGGTLLLAFDAMKNVSTNAATLGEKLLDGDIDRDSLGKIGVVGDPAGNGLGGDGTYLEGLAFFLDTSGGIDPSVEVRVASFTLEWLSSGDRATVVNPVTKESLECVGGGATYPSFDFDVSSLGLSVHGGESGVVASLFAREGSSFRVSGVNLLLSEPTSVSFSGSHHTGSSFVLNLDLQGVVPHGVDLYRSTALDGQWESLATDYAETNYVDAALPTNPAVFYKVRIERP